MGISSSASFSNATTASPPPPPSPPPSSPSRVNEKSNGPERPRFFDGKAKNKCWSNADVVPGRHPERWRKDAAGNVVCKRFGNCGGCLCFEYDHIVPYSKGFDSPNLSLQGLKVQSLIVDYVFVRWRIDGGELSDSSNQSEQIQSSSGECGC